MKICKKCGAKNSDDALFCDYCGNKLGEEFVFCESCGEKNLSDALFCQKCGHKLIHEDDLEKDKNHIPEKEIKDDTKENDPKSDVKTIKDTKNDKYFSKKSSKKSAKPIIFAMILLLFVGGGFFLFKNLSKPKNPNNFICYEKNDQLYFSDFSKNAPYFIANNYHENPYFDGVVEFSSDGEFMLYGDDYDEYDNFSLYKRYTNFKKDNLEKIDGEVSSFRLVNNDKDIIYNKDGSLYSYNLAKSKKEKIDSDVNDLYSISDNGRVLYRTNDNRFYVKELGKEKVKLASDVSEFTFDESNPDKIIFLNTNDTLYETTPSGEKQKVASNVFHYMLNKDASYYYFTGSYDGDNNKIYYKSFGGDSILVSKEVDQINTRIYPDGTALVFKKSHDDLYSKLIEEPGAGKEIKKPTPPKYPYAYDFDTYEEYQASYDEYLVEKDVYDVEYDAYRNYLNNSAKIQGLGDKVKEYLEKNYYDLYYFDGKESKNIGTAFNGLSYMDNNYNSVVYSPKETIDEKLNLSYLVDLDEYDIFNKLAKTTLDLKFINKGTVKKIGGDLESNEIYSEITPVMGNTENICYFLTSKNDFYKIDPNAEEIIPELYDSDVSGNPYILNNGKDLFYVKNPDSIGNGDLYHNKEKIDSDVYGFSLAGSINENRIFYGKGNFTKSSDGELFYFENGKTQKIDDNVQTFAERDDKIYYINDYSEKAMSGDLKVFSGNKSELIDTDVNYLLYPTSQMVDESDMTGC